MKAFISNPTRLRNRVAAAALCAGSVLLGAGLFGTPGAGALTLPILPPPHIQYYFYPTVTSVSAISLVFDPNPDFAFEANVTAKVVNEQTGAPVTSGTMTINWTDNSTGQTWSCEEAPISTQGTAGCSFADPTDTDTLEPSQVGTTDSLQAVYNGGRVHPGVVNELYSTSESADISCVYVPSFFAMCAA